MKEILLLVKGFFKKNKKHFLFPFLSIFIGVWGMIVVISVIKGFDKSLIDSLTSIYPHIIVYDKYNEKLKDEKFKMYFSTFQGFFNHDGKKITATYWKIDNIKNFNNIIIKGDASSCIVGDVLAQSMNLALGDKINLFYTDNSGKIKLENIKITGIFHSGIYIIDSTFLIKKESYENLNYTGIYLNNPKEAKKIKNTYLKNYLASTWEEQNENFSKAVEIDSYFALIITFFVVLMSGFSISNSVMYSIFVRKKEIGILYSLGLTQKKISLVFILESLIISILGYVLGLLSAIFTIFILKSIDIKLPSGVFYIDKIPFYISFNDILLSFIFIIGLSVIFSYTSSKRLLSFDPVEVLHDE